MGGCSKEASQKPLETTAAAPGAQLPTPDGGALFKQYCSGCHPDGGNVNDPKMNLHRSAMRANHITTPEDVVRVMRNPISRMIRFDAAALPDREAHAIAEYVLKTFN
jgi:cytochrome c6